MSKDLFITMRANEDDPQGAGWPVGVYPTQEAAEEAIARCREARETFNRLYEEAVKPHQPKRGSGSSSTKQSAEYPFPSKNGWFYAEKEWADFGDLEFDFNRREDVKAWRKQNKGEDYYCNAASHL